jgi:hypothetical protein
VRQRQAASIRLDDDRLSVLGAARAGGRVARVANAESATQLGQVTLVEDLADQTHARQVAEAFAVGGADARALLAAML